MDILTLLGEMANPAVYVPPVKNEARGKLPLAVRNMLGKNEPFSQLFVTMALARQAYFDDHLYQLFIDDCIDERRLRTALSFGEYDGVSQGSFVPPSIIDVMRTAGARTSFRSLATCMILDKGRHKLKHWKKRGLRLSLAHYSSSHAKASCAAWNHDTVAAVGYVRKFAGRVNHCYPGMIVALYGLADTDFDSVTVFGPNGVLDTLTFAKTRQDGHALTQAVADRLATIFPKNCEPIAKLDSDDYIEAFYTELAEYLVHNIDYVRRNISERRKVQLFEHTGRIICVGRHYEFLTEYGSGFLIDDHDPKLSTGLAIGLQYVGRNVIADAKGSGDWVIPVHVNIPYSDGDAGITGEHALELRQRIVETFAKKRRQAELASFWLENEHGVPKEFHSSLRKQLADGLDQRLAVSVSISNREDRLFRLDW